MTVLTAVFTAVLVLVTCYYAWQTNRLVDEMRKDRRERATPRLALDLRSEGAAFAPPSICNLGLGPALDVDVTMVFVPRDAAADLSGLQFVTRRWRTRLVAPGERERFTPPMDAAGDPLRMGELARVFRSVRLAGTCRTTFGETVKIEEELVDLGELWELAKGSKHLVDNDPTQGIIDGLGDIRKVLTKLVPKPSQAERRRQLAEGKAVMDEYRESDEGKAEAARTQAALQPPDDLGPAGLEDSASAGEALDQHRVGDSPEDGAGLFGREGGPGLTEQALPLPGDDLGDLVVDPGAGPRGDLGKIETVEAQQEGLGDEGLAGDGGDADTAAVGAPGGLGALDRQPGGPGGVGGDKAELVARSAGESTGGVRENGGDVLVGRPVEDGGPGAEADDLGPVTPEPGIVGPREDATDGGA
jgi:hypothetical protein